MENNTKKLNLTWLEKGLFLLIAAVFILLGIKSIITQEDVGHARFHTDLVYHYGKNAIIIGVFEITLGLLVLSIFAKNGKGALKWAIGSLIMGILAILTIIFYL